MQGLDHEGSQRVTTTLVIAGLALLFLFSLQTYFAYSAFQDMLVYATSHPNSHQIKTSSESYRQFITDSSLMWVFRVLSVIDLLFIVGFLIYLFVNRGGPTSSDTPKAQHIRILSRFAVDNFGNMFFDQWQDYAPGGKLYVQVQFEDGRERELITPWEIFVNCGEGMYGFGVVEGNYLIGFSPPVTIAQPTPIPPDPFQRPGK